MARSKTAAARPDLREFIKEHHQRLYDFCAYMLYGGGSVDDLVLGVFREFGQEFQRRNGGRDATWDSPEIRIRLFQIAWDRIREAFGHLQPAWSVGRDTRPMKSFDDDLLVSWKSGRASLNELEPAALERLARLDPDFRAPVVLRDVLGFGDEEVVRVLQVRWGVYRHRLHRGRLEYKDVLRGRPFTQKPGAEAAKDAPRESQ